ncbi:hypothetical protein OUZ56_017697 [Daphnia magna]|uniref:Uncharacterized protein n=1 Tax=Daphnia magna TaxID=35525 RepID=A0ABR0ATG8_9CRUS|nr:hypothetical protein OUZ56_017697 [Daphnia magna]
MLVVGVQAPPDGFVCDTAYTPFLGIASVFCSSGLSYGCLAFLVPPRIGGVCTYLLIRFRHSDVTVLCALYHSFSKDKVIQSASFSIHLGTRLPVLVA